MTNHEAFGLVLVNRADEALAGLLLLAGTVVGVAAMGALLVLVLALAPTLSHRAGVALRTRGVTSFLVGLGASLLLFLGGAAAAQNAAPISVAVWTCAMLLALVPASEGLGRRLSVLAGREGHRVSHLLWGWATLGLASIIPVVGWLAFSIAVVLGLGGSIVGFFAREDF